MKVDYIVLFLIMFLYSMFIILGQLIQLIIMHFHTHKLQK